MGTSGASLEQSVSGLCSRSAGLWEDTVSPGRCRCSYSCSLFEEFSRCSGLSAYSTGGKFVRGMDCDARCGTIPYVCGPSLFTQQCWLATRPDVFSLRRRPRGSPTFDEACMGLRTPSPRFPAPCYCAHLAAACLRQFYQGI